MIKVEFHGCLAFVNATIRPGSHRDQMKKYTTYGRVEREGTPNTDDLMKHKSCFEFYLQ